MALILCSGSLMSQPPLHPRAMMRRLPYATSLLFVAAVVACLALGTGPATVAGQALTPPPGGFVQKLGGLSKLYPPRPQVDCTRFSDCRSCTGTPTCAYCFDDIGINVTSGATQFFGFCANYAQKAFAKSCTGTSQKFYIPGQCSIPVLPGCRIDTHGNCILEYSYSAVNADQGNLDWARGWLIGVCVFLFVVIITGFNDKIAPQYGRASYNECMPQGMHLWSMFVAFSMQITAIAVNEWSFVNKSTVDERHHSFGPFGEWEKAMEQHFYCKDMAPGSDLATCRVLSTAAILVGIMMCLSLAIMIVRLICAIANDGNGHHYPRDTAVWKVDLLGCVCSAGAALLWASCHVMIGETMLQAANEAPHSKLHTSHSLYLQCVTTAFWLFTLASYAVEINTQSAPFKASPASLELQVLAMGNMELNVQPRVIETSVSEEVRAFEKKSAERPDNVAEAREAEEIRLATEASLAEARAIEKNREIDADHQVGAVSSTNPYASSSYSPAASVASPNEHRRPILDALGQPVRDDDGQIIYDSAPSAPTIASLAPTPLYANHAASSPDYGLSPEALPHYRYGPSYASPAQDYTPGGAYNAQVSQEYTPGGAYALNAQISQEAPPPYSEPSANGSASL